MIMIENLGMLPYACWVQGICSTNVLEQGAKSYMIKWHILCIHL